MANISNGDAADKRTKGNRVVMTFINEKGEAAKSPQPGCAGIHAQFVQSGNTDILDLRTFINEDGTPSDILFRLAAFGAATLGRNEVNTVADENGGAEQGEANCLGRWEGFRNKSYRSVSTGSATPIILLALERALKADARNLSEEAISAKVSEWRIKYDAAEIEDEKLQAKARRDVIRTLTNIAAVRDMEKQIREERAAERRKALPEVSLSDI